jgi:DNA-directed RNA polymerase subunit RPC12/RpoP
MEPEQTLICMECGGTAHLLSHRPEDDPFEAGDYAAYVCEDCSHRIDIVLEDDDDEVGLFAGQ